MVGAVGHPAFLELGVHAALRELVAGVLVLPVQLTLDFVAAVGYAVRTLPVLVAFVHAVDVRAVVPRQALGRLFQVALPPAVRVVDAIETAHLRLAVREVAHLLLPVPRARRVLAQAQRKLLALVDHTLVLLQHAFRLRAAPVHRARLVDARRLPTVPAAVVERVARKLVPKCGAGLVPLAQRAHRVVHAVPQFLAVRQREDFLAYLPSRARVLVPLAELERLAFLLLLHLHALHRPALPQEVVVIAFTDTLTLRLQVGRAIQFLALPTIFTPYALRV